MCRRLIIFGIRRQFKSTVSLVQQINNHLNFRTGMLTKLITRARKVCNQFRRQGNGGAVLQQNPAKMLCERSVFEPIPLAVTALQQGLHKSRLQKAQAFVAYTFIHRLLGNRVVDLCTNMNGDVT